MIAVLFVILLFDVQPQLLPILFNLLKLPIQVVLLDGLGRNLEQILFFGKDIALEEVFECEIF